MTNNENLVTPIPGIENLTYEDANILLNIQKLWLETIQWIRVFFQSVLENSPEQSAVGDQLFIQHPQDLYKEFRKHYSEEDSRQFLDIISRLISGNWQLVTFYKNKDRTSIDFSTDQWYKTADELAAFLAGINIYINKNIMKTLLHEYIDLKIKEIVALLNGDYVMETKIYDEIVDKAAQIASHMAMGTIALQHSNAVSGTYVIMKIYKRYA